MRLDNSSLRCPSAIVLLLVLASAGACNSPLDQGRQRIVGLIDNGGLLVDALVLSDTVKAGVAFTATVSTFGSSCLIPDGATVSVSTLTAAITPYDLAPPPGSICTADFRSHPRPVALVFVTPGTAVLILHGRGFGGPMSLTRSIVVQP
jgi:hypothetical protein